MEQSMMDMLKSNLRNIKNPPMLRVLKNFRFRAVNFFILTAACALGFALQALTGPALSMEAAAAAAAVYLAGAAAAAFVPYWVFMAALGVLGAGAVLYFGPYYALALSLAAGFAAAPAVQCAYQWEKAIVIRLGTYSRTKGPGVFWIIPFMEAAIEYVDTRIMATDFEAEKTLTRDTVPVTVDALCYWMIWNPKNAILEIQSIMDAVVLAAQASLRDAIGRHDLAMLLSGREAFAQEIKQLLDVKTSEWGITIISMGITDIVLPQELEEAMSRRAEAERVKDARVIASLAELEAADNYREAARRYAGDSVAIHLRDVAMYSEGFRKAGTILMVPGTAGFGQELGATALARLQESLATHEPDPELTTTTQGGVK